MLIFVVVVVSVVNGVLLINAKIPSSSMENTIMVNDRIFGNRLAYRSKDPERFDIIIFKFPDDESKKYIKRIIGMPGYVNVYRVVLLCVNMAFLSCPVHYKLQITVFFMRSSCAMRYESLYLYIIYYI